MAMVVDLDTTGELGFPYWKPIRRRFEPESPFFSYGNIERELLAKQVALDLTQNENPQLKNLIDEDDREVFCPIVGCGARLTSLEAFEDHYNARHTASCSVCSRVYPTSRLLSIHVSEAHDSFFQAKVARGYPMYECLVEGCGLKFINYKSRQRHLMDKHKFPSTFEFLQKARSSKKARQKQQHKRSTPKNKEASSKMDVEGEALDGLISRSTPKNEEASSKMDVEGEALDGLISAVSRLSTSDSSPSSINFGRRHNRGLTFVPRAVQREKSTHKPQQREPAI
ncbi:uncharacterized protein LOC126679956 [Mercurialis annua]|uniref:uncharacterized protein LOC126679956 n=1 Tax=Mercurialis annua TaxID=3986 RepID=UPI002160CBA3|nr:uncharacterized protein LOC126679956 [Mercurialis annua]